MRDEVWNHDATPNLEKPDWPVDDGGNKNHPGESIDCKHRSVRRLLHTQQNSTVAAANGQATCNDELHVAHIIRPIPEEKVGLPKVDPS
jgi:hypothetical protein